MELEEAIRTRRTHKAFGTEPVGAETIVELVELARWAPNHHLTNPWRFRALGPESRAALKAAAGPENGAKLDRAPTLIAVSAVRSPADPEQDEEDLCATAAAAFVVLLAAHGRGLAGYWRTPAVLRTAEGCSAVGIPDSERAVGLLHLGPPRDERPVPERAPVAEILELLP